MKILKQIMLDKPGKKRVVVSFKEKGQEIEVTAIVKGTAKGKYELEVVADHIVGENSGNIVIKGIAQNGAEVKVTGMIKIGKKAQRVEDFLEMRLLILDDISRAEAIPQLEIEADDVKASHAASVGKLDAEQIYYLMSRGLSKKKSKQMLVHGFLGELIAP